MSKEWSGGVCGNSGPKVGPGCCEEWSVHAQLTLSPPQAGNLTVTTTEGGRGDSGYGSEKGCTTPTARATCCVTLAGHHTVTLTCSELPLGQPAPGPGRSNVFFCNHHKDKSVSQAAPSVPPTHVHYHSTGTARSPPATQTLPIYRDAAIQTSYSHLPQVFEPETTQPQSTHHLDPKSPRGRGLRRSPARLRKHPKNNSQSESQQTGANSSDNKKNPRTVHIDVYCTGSESSDSSNSSDEESNSTPQTVFESDRLRVSHHRASGDSLPHSLQRQKRCDLSNPSIPSVRESFSSGYPSAKSSLVSGTDGLSLTSGSFLSSVAVTSAKDTDFSSRDSFDYENSFDRMRIKEKEMLWAAQRTQKQMSEEDTDSSDSEEGLAWSFDRSLMLKREDTIKRPTESTKSPSSKTRLSKSGSHSDSETSSHQYRQKSPVFLNLTKAKLFGPVVSSLKKPGHHIGPSKNPNCTCDTCRYFFEHICCRNRTRSLGDNPY